MALIPHAKKVSGYILPEFDRPTYKTLRALEAALKARNFEVHSILIHLAAELYQSEDGRQRLQDFLEAYRTTAPCELQLPTIEL
jgi:hypothetical protein